MKFKNAEKIFLLLIILLGVILFYGSSIVHIAFEEPITPKMYGQVLSGLLILMCFIRLIKLQFSKTDEEKKFNISNKKIILIATVAMILYTFGISIVGYFVTTFVYMLLMIYMLTDDRSKSALVKYAIGTLAFTVALYFIFDAFNVFLPNAWLI